MIDERANDLFWSQMAFLKEENARQRKQIDQLLARLENERKPLEEQIRQLLNTINELTEKVAESNRNTRLLQTTIDHLNQVILSKDEYTQVLLKKIDNLENQVKNGRRLRFGRSSEQRRLLNNRDVGSTDESIQGHGDHQQDCGTLQTGGIL